LAKEHDSDFQGLKESCRLHHRKVLQAKDPDPFMEERGCGNDSDSGTSEATNSEAGDDSVDDAGDDAR